jgi:hypothetical protein
VECPIDDAAEKKTRKHKGKHRRWITPSRGAAQNLSCCVPQRQNL